MIWATGSIREEKDLVPRLMVELNNKQPNARSGAAWALGKLGPDAREALPALHKLFFDEEIGYGSLFVFQAMERIKGMKGKEATRVRQNSMTGNPAQKMCDRYRGEQRDRTQSLPVAPGVADSKAGFRCQAADPRDFLFWCQSASRQSNFTVGRSWQLAAVFYEHKLA